ncbi:MAG TPA: hypothetical protein VFQ35_01665 [Polyangiaceae bacterium]|nr:hypothetical protein [Polyangiaceae bacterium]
MQRVDFFGLERPIQERFVAAARGTAPPIPLAIKRQLMPRVGVICLALAALALVTMLALTRVGYAKLDSSFALQPTGALVLYVVLGVACGALLGVAFRIQRARSRWPIAPAVYAFPAGVVDARSLNMEVHSLRDLVEATASGRKLNLAFSDGARFQFDTTDANRALELARAVNGFREYFMPDAAPVSARERAVWDPLADNGFSNPFSPRERIKKPKSDLSWVAVPLAAIVLAGFGALVFTVRNSLGERALYAVARKVDTRAGYEAYLERGGSNLDVATLLLPRAQLAEVVKKQSIDELVQFVKAHAGEPVDVEAQSALLKQLLAALEDAKRAGSLRALKEFRARFADQPAILGEVTRAINARTEAALARFVEKAHPKPEVLDAFRRLVAYGVEHDGVVQVRSKRRLPDSVAKSEELLQKAHWYGGKASLPGQYFDAAHAAQRERPTQKQIIEALSQAFDEDVLKFESGPAYDDNTDEDPKVTVPTILIIHRTEMSGAYLMKNPRAAITGVGVLFRISMLLPGAGSVHSFKYSAWNSPDVKSMMEGRPFEEIYDDMADKSFAKLTKKYLAEVVPGLAPKAQ